MKVLLFLLVFSCGFLLSNPTFANTIIQGRVIDSIGDKPVELASVIILEAKQKTRTNSYGEFSIQIPKQKKVTILIQSINFQQYKEVLQIPNNNRINKVFVLSPRKFGSRVITIRDKQNKQTLSRRSLTRQQIKEIPASFGDSLNAVTSLPGIARQSTFFIGNRDIILRGTSSKGQQYYIDKIPVLYPQHFGGFASIISNDIIQSLDVYSSGFPVDYGRAYGGIIEIETVDDVKKFRGYAEVSALSANVYLEGVIPARQKSIFKNSSSGIPQKSTLQKSALGYWIASGRVGYLGFTVLPLMARVLDITLPNIQYFDYQTKIKLFLDKKGKHNLKFLVIGAFDYTSYPDQPTVVGDESSSSSEDNRINLSTNIQGIYYQYQPSKRMRNNLFVYNTINYNNYSTVGGFSSKSFPNTASIKNDFEWEYWKDIGKLIISAGYELYWLSAKGIIETASSGTLMLSNSFGIDTSDPTANKIKKDVEFTKFHHNINAVVKLKFQHLGFFGNIGSRFEYLISANQYITDPRVLIGYEFLTETTISARTGLYQSFPQVNFAYFNSVFEQNVDIANAVHLEPERGWHNTLGIQQNFLELYKASVEGYVNIFDRYVQNYSLLAGERLFSSSGKVRNFGFEVLIQKERRENAQDFFAWASYTYTYSRIQTNIPGGLQGEEYIPFDYEQSHSLKLLFGYNFIQSKRKQHLISTRFELSSSFPYSLIVGSQANVSNEDGGGSSTTYIPIIGNRNANKFPIQHRLDIRYTYVQKFKWGTFKFYVELVNAYYFQSLSGQRWNRDQPYQEGVNPIFLRSNNIIPILPSFGFEFLF